MGVNQADMLEKLNLAVQFLKLSFFAVGLANVFETTR
jgi:hypothetical protein